MVGTRVFCAYFLLLFPGVRVPLHMTTPRRLFYGTRHSMHNKTAQVEQQLKPVIAVGKKVRTVLRSSVNALL